MLIICWRRSEPGISRPMPPASRVSPVKRWFATRKLRLPGVWPGVWMTRILISPNSSSSPSSR